MNSLASLGFASLVATICIALPNPCLAQKRLAGIVIAGSGCDLRPPVEGDERCPAVVEPIGGVLRLTRRGATVRISVDRDGTFEKRVPEGRYRIRIARAHRAGRKLKASDLALSSQFVTVGAAEEPVLLFVRHRSRPLGEVPGIAY